MTLLGTRKPFDILAAASSKEARLAEHLQAVWSSVNSPTETMRENYNDLDTCLPSSDQYDSMTKLATEILVNSDVKDDCLRAWSDITGFYPSNDVEEYENESLLSLLPF